MTAESESTTPLPRGSDRRPDPAGGYVVRPIGLLLPLAMRDLIDSRSILMAMVRRQIRVGTGQYRLGGLAFCVRPLTYLLVFAALRQLSGMQTRVDIPYLLHVFTGMLLWHFLQDSTQAAATSVRVHAPTMTKMYLHPFIPPMVQPVANVVLYGYNVVPLALLLLYFSTAPSWRLVLLPIVILQTTVLAISVGLLLAPFAASRRDTDSMLSAVLHVGMIVSPVIYAPAMIPAAARSFYELNPMVGSLEAFRSCLVGSVPFPTAAWAYSVLFSLALLLVSQHVYRRRIFRALDQL